jgi:hypothetical protein
MFEQFTNYEFSVTMGGECAKGSRSNKTLRYHVEDGIFQRKNGNF